MAAIDAQAYYRGVEDLELWMSEIEAHLASDDYGKDLASCHNLIKKHQLLEVDVQQHRDRVEGVYRQCKKFTEAKHFDTPNIKHKQEEVQRRYVDLRVSQRCLDLLLLGVLIQQDSVSIFLGTTESSVYG